MQPLAMGRIASFYYMRHQTMATFAQALGPGMDVQVWILKWELKWDLGLGMSGTSPCVERLGPGMGVQVWVAGLGGGGEAGRGCSAGCSAAVWVNDELPVLCRCFLIVSIVPLFVPCYVDPAAHAVRRGRVWRPARPLALLSAHKPSSPLHPLQCSPCCPCCTPLLSTMSCPWLPAPELISPAVPAPFLQSLLPVLCAAAEYDELPVRHNEDRLNVVLNQSVRWPADTRTAGANCQT